MGSFSLSILFCYYVLFYATVLGVIRKKERNSLLPIYESIFQKKWKFGSSNFRDLKLKLKLKFIHNPIFYDQKYDSKEDYKYDYKCNHFQKKITKSWTKKGPYMKLKIKAIKNNSCKYVDPFCPFTNGKQKLLYIQRKNKINVRKKKEISEELSEKQSKKKQSEKESNRELEKKSEIKTKEKAKVEKEQYEEKKETQKNVELKKKKSYETTARKSKSNRKITKERNYKKEKTTNTSLDATVVTDEVVNEEEEEMDKQMYKQREKEDIEKENLEKEREKKIHFIKTLEHLLIEDEKNVQLKEERENIENLRFGDKPPPRSESLMEEILKNIHSNDRKKKNNSFKRNEDSEVKKKHLFYELLRISNSNSFKTHKIYTHKDLLYGMKYRKLGNSNLCVSELCVGTSMYENEEFISKDDVNVLLNMAFYEYGINFFDICEYDPFPFDPESYRKSRNRNMNLFLKDKNREQIIINLRMCSSRNVNELVHGEFYLSWIMEGIKGEKPTFYNLEERLDKILKNLNTNYVDILTIDLPERYIPNAANGEDTYVWGFEELMQGREENNETYIETDIETDKEIDIETDKETDKEIKTIKDANEMWKKNQNAYPFMNEKINRSIHTKERKTIGISIEEQFDILERIIEKGKVRYIAVSNESVWGLYKWCSVAKKRRKKNMKIVCVQNLYNLLHKNEVESSGLVEFILKENYDVPLIPYGLLAGGILTGKYLDPERYHTMGPDTILGDDQLDHELDETRGNKAEDYGYLSYGPKNGRCNKYPDFYKSHRCVWAQDAVGEYLKLARSHGMTLAQLSLSYVYSRPFVASSIIGPRTIGQLKDSVLTLNYPLYKHLETDIHEIFLRYRGCTMDGNTILNSLKDPNKTSQTQFYKTANIPILSGGTYWKNYPLPPLMKRYKYTDMKAEKSRIESTFGLNDIPNDSNFINARIWVEREKRKGEYFALKESTLFKWNKLKLHKGTLMKLSNKEKYLYDTEHFHFCFKNEKVSVIPTDEEIENFYKDEEKIKKIIQQTVNDHQELFQYQDQLGRDVPSIFNNLDLDLIYKQLLNRHNINVLDRKQLDELYQYIKLTPYELKTEDYWYIYKYNPFDSTITYRTGTEP